MVDLHQIQQKSVAKNILKNWRYSEKRPEFMGRRDKAANTDSTVTKKCS